MIKLKIIITQLIKFFFFFRLNAQLNYQPTLLNSNNSHALQLVPYSGIINNQQQQQPINKPLTAEELNKLYNMNYNVIHPYHQHQHPNSHLQQSQQPHNINAINTQSIGFSSNLINPQQQPQQYVPYVQYQLQSTGSFDNNNFINNSQATTTIATSSSSSSSPSNLHQNTLQTTPTMPIQNIPLVPPRKLTHDDISSPTTLRYTPPMGNSNKSINTTVSQDSKTKDNDLIDLNNGAEQR